MGHKTLSHVLSTQYLVLRQLSRTNRRTVIHGVLLPLVCFLISMAGAEDSDKLFKDSVRPLFERKCFQCHSSKADELKGNLKLESLETILKGGDQGPAVIAGDVENSFFAASHSLSGRGFSNAS